jgi:tRNA(fMet)-specific endonuclease VapC
VAIPIITRLEILQGRFAAVFKAEDGERLMRAQELLSRSEARLSLLRIIPVTDAAAAEFDRLRQDKKLKKLGRGDLLIASIALARSATLVTRNVKDFRLIRGLRLENWAG